jgi:hypothetical protein
MSAFRKTLAVGLANIVIAAVLFAVLEGSASILFVAHEILRTPGVPEHGHAEHDALLGWVNRPDVHLPDFYGPGLEVRINSQRFRSSLDFTHVVPSGKRRIICSGDSFTFGYGVGNNQTWCQRLEAIGPSLETINMGLGGYGVDQAYLWYMRDGAQFDHQLHLFALLTDDFRRMRSDRFMGYGKPLLIVQQDSLAVANLPVPRTSRFAHWRALHGETIARLNVVRLLRKLFRLDIASVTADRDERGDPHLRDIVARVFADLRRVNDAKRSRLVLVYLPGAWDYRPSPETDAWRRFVQEEALRQGIIFFDLVQEIREVPSDEIDHLFGPHAHFSLAGNVWVAEVLGRRLSPVLDSLPGGPVAGTPSHP